MDLAVFIVCAHFSHNSILLSDERNCFLYPFLVLIYGLKLFPIFQSSNKVAPKIPQTSPILLIPYCIHSNTIKNLCIADCCFEEKKTYSNGHYNIQERQNWTWAIHSIAGEIKRQGPHQLATNSTRTGRSEFRTESWNWVSLISWIAALAAIENLGAVKEELRCCRPTCFFWV